jgi:hypothetical protein
VESSNWNSCQSGIPVLYIGDTAIAQPAIFQPPTVEAGALYEFGPCESYGGELELGQVPPRPIPFFL